ncbi:MAG: methyltransferase domain-containing protein [Planctomycetes bacterium]|nr:methyltransferase domain-containing protein [Planctomycetota bacterium]
MTDGRRRKGPRRRASREQGSRQQASAQGRRRASRKQGAAPGRGRGVRQQGSGGETGRRASPESFQRRATVRSAALEILAGSEESRRFVDELLAERLSGFEPRDRHLLQEIVFGTVRHQNTLDLLLGAYIKLAVGRQRAPIRWALRLGAYQLIYLRRIPAHAAVNQTVEGLKGCEGVASRDAGFVNAVLHALAGDMRRKTDEPPLEITDPSVLPIRRGYCHLSRPFLPLSRLDLAEHLALRHSHPRWLVERWLARFGEEECRRLLEANNIAPHVTARVTSKALSREAVLEELRAEGIEAEAGPRDDAILFGRTGDLSACRALIEGRIQVQDLTAMELGAVLKPPSGARVLDLCSAPGGKAAQLLDAVGPGGHVVAADLSDEKLGLVRQNLEKLGSNFTLVKLPESPDAIDLGESFTHVLVDAPCSNTGVLARRPDARWRIRPSDLDALAGLQRGLLEAACRHLSPGGRLLYSTCSLEPEENEEQVAALVGRHPDLAEIDLRQVLPHRAEGDGGFCSLLLRGRSA